MNNVALIFPGQGAQAVGMGREFYDHSPQAKSVFDQADTVIKGLSEVIFNGPAEKLTSTAYCQPGIFTFSMAALKALEAHEVYQNISPKFAAGLSLGECSAVCASGALKFEEALRLVERRSFHMEEATKAKKGAMAAVIGMEKDLLVSICEEAGAQVANYNSPDQIVITGEENKVKAASLKIQEAGAKRVIALDVSGAFHSSLMAPAVEQFKLDLNKAPFKDARVPVVSNVDGLPASAPQKIIENLARQITSSVRWVDAVQYIASKGVTTFIEIGPGTVLKGLIRKIDRNLTVYTIQTPQDIEKLFS